MTVSDRIWRKVARDRAWTEQDGRCAYCGCPLLRSEVTADHVIPRVAGGTDHRNIVAACSDCNLAKAYLPVEKFRKMLRAPGFPTSPHLTEVHQWRSNMARVRYRLNKRTDLAVKRILALAGLKP